MFFQNCADSQIQFAASKPTQSESIDQPDEPESGGLSVDEVFETDDSEPPDNSQQTQIEIPIVPVAPPPVDTPDESCNATNLVDNGSFEIKGSSPDLRNNKNRTLADLNLNDWGVFDTLPSESDLKTYSWYTDYGTSGMEVQRGTTGAAIEGQNYIELDSHGNSTNGNVTNSAMSQNIELEAGTYEASLSYRSRTGNADNDGIQILVNDVVIGEIKADHGDWLEYKYTVEIPASTSVKLTLKAVGTENTYGGLIDDIKVVRTDCQ